MNTQVHRLANRRNSRVYGLTFLDKFAAWARLKYEACRAHMLAIEAQEALKAMSPELLDDIGASIDKTGNPVAKIASQNPHVLAAAVFRPRERYQDPY
jgi:hypothetical protein